MRRSLQVLCLVCLVGSALAAPIPQGARKPPPKPVDPTLVHDFLGRVKYIDLECIVLKPEGYLRIEYNRLNAEGIREEFYYEQDNTQPARLFKFSDRMLIIEGLLPPPNPRLPVQVHRGEHRISEVLIGDRVYVSFGTRNGDTFCSDLTIVRRPGGRVPDAYGDDDPRYKVKVSAQRNAEQFLEETFAGKWAPRLGVALRR